MAIRGHILRKEFRFASRRYGLPPLAPPRPPDENAQLRVPAVCELLVWIQIEKAIRAELFPVRHRAQYGVICQVSQLECAGFINRLWYRDGAVIVHGRLASQFRFCPLRALVWRSEQQAARQRHSAGRPQPLEESIKLRRSKCS